MLLNMLNKIHNNNKIGMTTLFSAYLYNTKVATVSSSLVHHYRIVHTRLYVHSEVGVEWSMPPVYNKC